MEKVIIISLIITSIHVSMMPTMILHFITLQLKKLPSWTWKPLFECMTCMGGLWTLILYPIIYHSFDWITILTMLQVIGLNTIIAALIQRLND